ncbi:transposase [Roseibium litorale]|uniref:transposase n=1 Tax=Roseibium litorale TaxID=2803841 RepID=UPI003CCD78C8
MAKRRNFSDALKAKAALEALRGDKTIQEIAAKYQVHPNQVSPWKRQAVEGMADVSARGGKSEGPTEAEVKELHAKIGRLTGERDLPLNRCSGRWFPGRPCAQHLHSTCGPLSVPATSRLPAFQSLQSSGLRGERVCRSVYADHVPCHWRSTPSSHRHQGTDDHASSCV